MPGRGRTSAAGKALDEVAGAAASLIGRTHVYAALDTLENLRRGGRVGAARALLGSMLSIKPIIAVRDGLVEPESKPRTRARALRHLVEKVRQHPGGRGPGRRARRRPDVDQLLDQLAAVYTRGDVTVAQVNPVIGTHAGPRVVGVSFHVPG